MFLPVAIASSQIKQKDKKYSAKERTLQQENSIKYTQILFYGSSIWYSRKWF